MVALPDTRPDSDTTRDQRMWLERVPAQYWVLGILLLIIPSFASDFVMFQIMGWTYILGLIALSLMFLGGYGGMVSLAQMTLCFSAVSRSFKISRKLLSSSATMMLNTLF